MKLYEHLVVLPESVEEILAIGHARAPHEACGILLPDGRVIECTNKSDEPHDSYILDPAEAFDKLEGWLENLPPGVEAVDMAVWHTHPGGGIGPSKGDMDERIKGVRYLVITLPTGEVSQY